MRIPFVACVAVPEKLERPAGSFLPLERPPRTLSSGADARSFHSRPGFHPFSLSSPVVVHVPRVRHTAALFFDILFFAAVCDRAEWGRSPICHRWIAHVADPLPHPRHMAAQRRFARRLAQGGQPRPRPRAVTGGPGGRPGNGKSRLARHGTGGGGSRREKRTEARGAGTPGGRSRDPVPTAGSGGRAGRKRTGRISGDALPGSMR
uniref:Uncharacterized protein n=1 Tax=Desulfovibrio sp. U5L TaxID=596152 RepID=I2Q351_9BACT